MKGLRLARLAGCLWLTAGLVRAARQRKYNTATVLYDGNCPFCVRCAQLLHRWDTECRLRPEPAASETVPAQMMVVFPDGEIIGGFEAVRAVLRFLPRWKWLSPLLYLPGMDEIGRELYRFVAARRYLFGRCDGGICTPTIDP